MIRYGGSEDIASFPDPSPACVVCKYVPDTGGSW